MNFNLTITVTDGQVMVEGQGVAVATQHLSDAFCQWQNGFELKLWQKYKAGTFTDTDQRLVETCLCDGDIFVTLEDWVDRMKHDDRLEKEEALVKRYFPKVIERANESRFPTVALAQLVPYISWDSDPEAWDNFRDRAWDALDKNGPTDPLWVFFCKLVAHTEQKLQTWVQLELIPADYETILTQSRADQVALLKELGLS